VWNVDAEGAQAHHIEIALEEPLSLQVNGAPVAVLMRLPGMEKELAAGFCVSEGLVGRFDDILTIYHCGQGLPGPEDTAGSEGEWRNRVEVRVRPEALRADARLDAVRLIRAGCGGADVAHADLDLPVLEGGPVVAAQALLEMGAEMRRAKGLHESVGGVHAVGLFSAEGRLARMAEDVGRHNAVDKAAGYCLLRGIRLQNQVIVCSGRLSYEMVNKAIRLGVAVLASFSAPTALAVDLAERCGITMVGYLRPRRMIVYTHPERVTAG
jgi:FdhD protein